MTRRPVALLLALALVVSTVPSHAEEAAPSSSASAEEAWRTELREAREGQTRMRNAGIITGLAGAGLILAGNFRAGSAQNVDGCERDGAFKVLCETEDSKNEAQDRIDEGRGILIAGLATGALALGFLVTASRRRGNVEELERTGRQQGYKLSLAPTKTDGLEIRLSRSF